VDLVLRMISCQLYFAKEHHWIGYTICKPLGPWPRRKSSGRIRPKGMSGLTMRSAEPRNQGKIADLPVRCSNELVELRFALLTVVKLWAHGLVGKAHTAPVLPYMAVVALDEKVPNIVGQGIRRIGVVDLTTTVLRPSL